MVLSKEMGRHVRDVVSIRVNQVSDDVSIWGEETRRPRGLRLLGDMTFSAAVWARDESVTQVK